MNIHIVRNSLKANFSRPQKLHYVRTWCIEKSWFDYQTQNAVIWQYIMCCPKIGWPKSSFPFHEKLYTYVSPSVSESNKWPRSNFWLANVDKNVSFPDFFHFLLFLVTQLGFWFSMGKSMRTILFCQLLYWCHFFLFPE